MLLPGSLTPISDPKACRAVVWTVTVAVAGVLPSNVADDGEILQVAVAGAPVQLNKTLWLNPLRGRTTAVNCPVLPAEIVAALGDAARAKSGLPAAPVPLNLTTVGTTLELSLMVSLPLLAPIAMGVNVTLIMQDPPTVRVAGQLFTAAKSPPVSTASTVRGEVPLFAKVAVCAALFVPTGWVPKLRLGGVAATTRAEILITALALRLFGVCAYVAVTVVPPVPNPASMPVVSTVATAGLAELYVTNEE